MAKSFPNTGATVIDATADLPGSPSEGMMVFQKDTNELKIYDGASWVSMLDTDNAPMDAWTSWTPAASTLFLYTCPVLVIKWAPRKQTRPTLNCD